MDKLVHIGTARVPGEPRLSITSVATNLAGSNRSGKQRLLPDQAGTSDSESADSTASRSLSETTAGTQVVVVIAIHQTQVVAKGSVLIRGIEESE